MKNFKDYDYFMSLAIEEAEKAYQMDEVPVGALVVSAEGKVLARAHNLKEKVNDPCGHAEILAIRQACESIGSWRLERCTLFVTLEPCLMCLGTLVQARIGQLVFGAYDQKSGSISLGYDFFKDKRLNHNFNLIGGLKHYECSNLLSTYFRQKRKNNPKLLRP